MKRIISTFSILLSLTLLLSAQTEKVDLEMVYRIKQEGQQRSQIQELAFWLTDYIGPRLTGSTGNTRANEWAKTKMEEFGFQNVIIEPARSFNRGGWDNLKTYAAMTAPYYASFACNPVAWTGSTNGLVKGEVVLLDVKSENDLKKYRGRLKDRIVLIPSTNTYDVSFDPLAKRYTDERLKEITLESAPSAARRPAGDISATAVQMRLAASILTFLKSEGASVIIRSSGTFNVPRSTAANYRSGEKEPGSELVLPVEAHGRMERLIHHNVPVEMEVEIINKFIPAPTIYNVIGEIPGTDLRDEVVMLGAHIDSWHGGTGAADNASGCIVMMEALRILKDLGAAPRRTIRIALWGGEEQGLNGSRGYVEKHLFDPLTREPKPDHDKFSTYFNMDNGTGRYRGIYLQQNEMVRPIFEQWFEPFASLGCSTIAIRNTTGTDHLAFDAAGLPGFQFIQDEIEYGRGYHTVMDTYERLIMADLRINAVITASLVYHAAMRDEKMPRKR